MNARQIANYDSPRWLVITFVGQNNLVSFVLGMKGAASALPCLCVRYDVPAELDCRGGGGVAHNLNGRINYLPSELKIA